MQIYDFSGTTIGAILVAALLLVLGLMWLWGQWKQTQDDGGAWLEPYAVQGIIAGFKLSEMAGDEFGERLHGMDKRAMAVAGYAFLPPEFQARVSPEAFGLVIDRVYPQVVALYERNEAGFRESFAAWQAEQGEGARASPAEWETRYAPRRNGRG